MSGIGDDFPPYRVQGKSFAKVAEMRRLSEEGVILSFAVNPDDALFRLQVHRDLIYQNLPDVVVGDSPEVAPAHLRFEDVATDCCFVIKRNLKRR
jgi:hypothetical protein